MNVKQIRYVVAMDDYHTMAAAAKSLGVSQSTLSKHLDGLERQLGVSLFMRSHGQLIPTPYGSVYLDAARHVISVFEASRQAIARLSDESRCEVAVGLPLDAPAQLQAQLVEGLWAHHPEICLRLHTAELPALREAVRAGTLTLALTELGDALGDEFAGEAVAQTELVLAVPASAFLDGAERGNGCGQRGEAEQGDKAGREGDRDPAPIPLGRAAEALGMRAFVLPAQGTALRGLVDSLLAASGVAPTVICETDSPAVSLELVARGLGCALLPACQVHKKAVDSDLRVLCLAESPAIRRFLFWRAHHSLSPEEAACAHEIERLIAKEG